MNIVVAPDSFKGSLTSIKASEIMKKAITIIDKDCRVSLKPMADGGEGTLESMLASTKGQRISITCTGPLGEKADTSYAIVDSHTAIIECASIAGLVQVPEDERNPDLTTTLGIGEAMMDALDKGCTSFVLGLGGSATNDGGLGMLMALGMKAWDQKGSEVGPYGKDVQQVSRVSFKDIDERLAETDIKVASDVDNPLCGERGATHVYGPQKGLRKEDLERYDSALDRYGDAVESVLEKHYRNIPGAGAAGGLGFALLAIGGSLVSGAKLLADAMNTEEAIQNADLVLTGEGQSDEQTLYGKAPGYIASLAQKYHVPAVLISGSLDGNLDVLGEKFSGCFSIVNKPLSLKECMENADQLLYEQTKQVIRLSRI
ncbi:glycerate kinase [Lentibacillus amyloliquefaciens]|uniref:Glycerate kinase n=1 Tax=Lentibacillus amyloliquefaciens TaxID=1472767 RepID=A0A0U4FRF4_9BACI|nr:glycerate kinase [Lentibacillus amyloliquefaciens]ALX50292.1 glycerate kinase [Lentibacillus amyloliquefaciens]